MSLLGSVLPVQNIILDLDVGSKKRVFEQVGVLLENEIGVKRADVFDCLFSREKLGSTGLGQHVAIPHGCISQLEKTVGVFVRTKEGIPFDAPDGLPVQVMFVLLAPRQESNSEHLQILSELAEKFSSKTLIDRLLSVKTPDEIRNMLLG